MTLLPDDYDGARRVLDDLLAELGIADYVFAVEPAADGWRVRVECAADGGWQTSNIHLEHDTFAAANEAGEARRTVLLTLDAHLAACRRRP